MPATLYFRIERSQELLVICACPNFSDKWSFAQMWHPQNHRYAIGIHIYPYVSMRTWSNFGWCVGSVTGNTQVFLQLVFQQADSWICWRQELNGVIHLNADDSGNFVLTRRDPKLTAVWYLWTQLIINKNMLCIQTVAWCITRYRKIPFAALVDQQVACHGLFNIYSCPVFCLKRYYFVLRRWFIICPNIDWADIS